MIRKMLVAIDGSEHADHALDFALDLANRSSAKVLLLTVVPPVFLPLPSLNVIGSQAIAEASAEMERIFLAALSKAEEKAKKLTSLPLFTRLEHGNPDEVIVQIAEEGTFDLIVLGSRGLGRGAYAIGSTSSRVAETAKCPVLIVK